MQLDTDSSKQDNLSLVWFSFVLIFNIKTTSSWSCRELIVATSVEVDVYSFSPA